MATKNIKNENLPKNKWEFGAFLIKHWVKVILMIFCIGFVILCLQIKNIKYGDNELTKQSLKDTVKNVRN